MADYDLNRLGERQFEHMVQSLFHYLTGSRGQTFGIGADGGREATLLGESTLSASGEAWDGYHVLQVKFRNHPPSDVNENKTWAIRQLDREVGHWADPESKRSRLGRLPEYFIYAVNVRLSATEEGGIDSVEERLRYWVGRLGMKGALLWHYDSLCRFLDANADIRRAFAGLITPGDVLDELVARFGLSQPLAEILRLHAGKELLSERWIRLGQAGDAEDQRIQLQEVCVDLPAFVDLAGDSRTSGLLHDIIGVSNESEVGESAARKYARHLVFVGGPGQGKSTLSQLLCQLYRVRMVSASLRDESARAVATAFKAQHAALGLPEITNVRWPFKIVLSAYADRLSADNDLSLFRYMCDVISARSGEGLRVADLRRWLQEWPSLLVLDGLDEVASPSIRDNLTTKVRDLLFEASELRANILLISTTRPQGYRPEFFDEPSTHYYMSPLRRDEALAYAQRLVASRHPDDTEAQEELVRNIASASTNELTARLMRTPLQVTILSLLIELQRQAPQTRYELFDRYFTVIYNREQNKPGFLADLLARHKRDILAVHQRVGFELQALSERAGQSDALLPAEILREITAARLRAEGHTGSAVDELADRLVTAATHRLVLLVPKGEAGVGFELRSLQEFMASRWLTEGADRDVIAALHEAVHAAHWRNTWLLAAGRIFATQEHLREQLIAMLRTVDAESEANVLVGSGRTMAQEILVDDVAYGSPQFERLLMEHAAQMLHHPPTGALLMRFRHLAHLCKKQPLRAILVREIVQSSTGNSMQRCNAFMAAQALSAGAGVMQARMRQLLASLTLTDGEKSMIASLDPDKAEEASVEQIGRRNLDAYLPADVTDLLSSPDGAAALEAVRQELARIHMLTLPPDGVACLPADPVEPTLNWSTVATSFEHSEVADAIAAASGLIDPVSWRARTEYTLVVSRWLQLRPVSHAIAEAIGSP